MRDYKELYKKLKDEYENYQNFAEEIIANINQKNTKLEKNLDSIINLLEISKYINSYLSDKNLVPVINDAIIGILGVKYSSIYIYDKNNIEVKASNKITENDFEQINEYKKFFSNEPKLLNSKVPIFKKDKCKQDVYSIIVVPIQIMERLLGYIVVEHSLCGFFDKDHLKFISSIAHQIGVALENNFLYSKIKESSLRDPLLDLYNRKYFYEFVSTKIKSTEIAPFAIVMLDIDDFKKVNDNYGHQFGDQMLMNTAKIIKRSLRKTDIVARYGGEEIVIFFEDANDVETIRCKVENIRRNIAESKVSLREICAGVTASFGISFYPKDGASIEDVIKKADLMLYKAKNSGKNKVIATIKNDG